MINGYLKKIGGKVSAAFRRTIGIYNTGNKVYVVEIQNTLNKTKEIDKRCYSLKNNTLENILKQVGEKFNVKETLFVTNITSPASVYKIIKIPQMPKDEINDWLSDNLESLIQTPLKLSQSVLNFKIIESNQEILVFISLHRCEEIEILKEVFLKNHLILHSISPGLSDLASNENELSAVYIQQPAMHEFIVTKAGELIYYNQIPIAVHKNETKIEKLREALENFLKDDLQLLNIEQMNWKDFAPNSETAGFEAAAAIAKRALRTPSTLFNIHLPHSTTEYYWKQLFLKTTLIFGVIFIVLFSAAYIPAIVFTSLNTNVLQQEEKLRSKTLSIRKLQREKSILQQFLSEAAQIKNYRSNSSIVLDAIAYHIKEGCWVTAIQYKKNATSKITGMGTSREAINRFLHALENDKNLRNVDMKYIKKVTLEKMYRQWKVKTAKLIEFSISFRY
jgi:Tfp pilus assembly protein PilN